MSRTRIVAIAAVALAGAAAALTQTEKGRLLWIHLRGDASVCPLIQTLYSRDHGLATVAIKDRLIRQSRRVEKDSAGYTLWQTPAGRYWMPAGSDYALHWDLAEQEQNIYGEGGNGVRPGDIVLDCGANVGVYTRVALNAGARLVVAIEIAPENLECLRRNMAEEIQAGRVIVYPKGVWDKDDMLTLNVSTTNSAANSVVMHPAGETQGPQVPLSTIDKIAAELQLSRVDFIKMDIEGAERNALRGARATISKFHPRMALSVYHRGDDPQVVPSLALAAWPKYRVLCGPCADGKTFVRPDILYFQ